MLPATLLVHRQTALFSTHTVPGCSSVRPSVSMDNSSFISATPTGRICVKFYIEDVCKKNCREIPDLVKIGQKIGHFTRRPTYVLWLPAK